MAVLRAGSKTSRRRQRGNRLASRELEFHSRGFGQQTGIAYRRRGLDYQEMAAGNVHGIRRAHMGRSMASKFGSRVSQHRSQKRARFWVKPAKTNRGEWNTACAERGDLSPAGEYSRGWFARGRCVVSEKRSTLCDQWDSIACDNRDFLVWATHSRTTGRRSRSFWHIRARTDARHCAKIPERKRRKLMSCSDENRCAIQANAPIAPSAKKNESSDGFGVSPARLVARRVVACPSATEIFSRSPSEISETAESGRCDHGDLQDPIVCPFLERSKQGNTISFLGDSITDGAEGAGMELAEARAYKPANLG